MVDKVEENATEEVSSDDEVKLDAKKDTLNVKELDERKIEEDNIKRHQEEKLTHWKPKTELGRKVKSGDITSVDEIYATGKKILEVEIIDTLFPNLESELLLIGQSKGKFGGGARRVFKQTQKKTKEGNKPSFATMAVVGNKDGYVGIGYAKAKETVPAREKALRKAKISLFPIKRGSGSWLSSTSEPHSIPFAVTGKCGSVKITLMPAPVGKGLIIEKECKKILELAGISDIWSKTTGQTGTKLNLILACVDALKQLNKVKISKKKEEELSIVQGNRK
ncbi:30S ribosomal protein S5 [Candidatus Woesearchaeota archaeon]|nr:30S ribosomal protein S5 [Candidatus Woesearchaeota archaeon]